MSCFSFILESKIFTRPTDKQVLDGVTTTMPEGQAWVSKYITSTTMWALMKSTSAVIKAVRDKVADMALELNVYTTTNLLSNWEKSVNLPDSRLPNYTLDLCQRRQNVLNRLSHRNTITLTEVQTLIDTTLPDLGIWLTTNEGGKNFRYDFRYDFGSSQGARDRFTFIVNVMAFSLTVMSWENIQSFLRDFNNASTMFILNIVPGSASKLVMTYPQPGEVVYTTQDPITGSWSTIDVHWMKIDILNTVEHFVDTEVITPATTSISRTFIDSSMSVITEVQPITVIEI